MIKRLFKHSFIAGLLLFALSATDSFARPGYSYEGYISSNSFQPYNSRQSYGYRSGYSNGYDDYGYRRGYRDGRRFRRWKQQNYRRRGGYGYRPRYCPTPRRY